MTKEEKLAVFKAYLDGEPIQAKVKNSGGNSGWFTIGFPQWNFTDCDYRVKPEETPADNGKKDWKAESERLLAALKSANDGWSSEVAGLEAEKKHLFDQNKKLQSAYDEMKGQRDSLQEQLTIAMSRTENQRANFVTLSDNYSAAIEQRDKAEQEADSLRGALNALHDSLHNAILS